LGEVREVDLVLGAVLHGESL